MPESTLLSLVFILGVCIHLHRLTKLLCILYKRSLLTEILGPKLGQAVGLAFWGEGYACVWAEKAHPCAELNWREACGTAGVD